jgi:hypothetical protein
MENEDLIFPHPSTRTETEVAKLQELAQQKKVDTSFGRELVDKAKSFGNFALKALDTIETPFYAMGGILSGVGAKKGIQDKITVSQALFGKEYASDQLFQKGTIGRYVGKTLEFIGRSAVDLFTDPATWIFPAALGTTKLIYGESGNLARIAKNGIQVMKGLTEDVMATHFAGQTEVADIAKKAAKIAEDTLAQAITGQKEALAKGKIYNISKEAVKKVLELSGIEATPEKIAKAIEEGLPELRAKRTFKLVSPIGNWEKDLFAWDRMRPAYEKLATVFNKGISKLPLGEETLKVAKETASSVRKYAFDLFHIGRPEGVSADEWAYAKQILQLPKYALAKRSTQYQKDLAIIFAKTKPQDEIRLGEALETYNWHMMNGRQKEAQAVMNGLSEQDKGLVKSVQKLYEHVSQLEQKNGLLERSMDYYQSAIYKNKKYAEEYLGKYTSDKLSTYNKFGQRRTIRSWLDLPPEEIEKLQPVKSIRALVSARLEAHNQVMAVHDLVTAISTDRVLSQNKWGLFNLKNDAIPKEVTQRLFENLHNIPAPVGEYGEPLNLSRKVMSVLNDVDSQLVKGKSTTYDVLDLHQKLKDLYVEISKKAKVDGSFQDKRIAKFIGQKLRAVEDLTIHNEEWADAFLKTGLNKVLGTTEDKFPDLIKVLHSKDPQVASKYIMARNNVFVPLGDYVKLGKAGENIDPAVKDVLDNVKNKNVWVERWLADELVNTANKSLFNSKQLYSFFKGIRIMQQPFKYGVTIPFPAFHVGNALGDTMNQAAHMGFDIINPRMYERYRELAIGKIDHIVDDFGFTITREELLNEFEKYNIKSDRVAFIAEDDKSSLLEKMKKMPVIGHYLGWMEKGGEFRENLWRQYAYFTHRVRGYDPITATSLVNKAQVDYLAATPFEREFMGTVFPFYKWQKQNVLSWIETGLTKTGRVAQMVNVWNSVNDIFGAKKLKNPEEAKYLPEYIKNQPYVYLTTKNNKNYFLYNFRLPLEQAWDMLPHFGNPVKAWLNQLTPMIKIPLEIGTGYDFYKDQHITDDFSGKQFDSPIFTPLYDWLEYRKVTKKDVRGREYTVSTVDPKKKFYFNAIADSFGISRLIGQQNIKDITAPLNYFYDLFSGKKPQFDDWAQMLHALSGAIIYQQNPARDQATYDKEIITDYGKYLERMQIVKDFTQYYKDKHVDNVESW